MFNLLRMDLYRLIRSKSVYIGLAFLLAFSLIAYWLVWMVSTPEGQKAAASIGMTVLSDTGDTDILVEGYDTLGMFRDIAMDGGAYACVLGIITVLFFCSDYSSGFMKNIMSLHRRRWEYIMSKLIATGLLHICFLIVQFGFCMLLNVLFHHLVPAARPLDVLVYLFQIWAVIMGFTALFLLICTVTRSASAGIVSVIALSSGILVTIVSYFTGLFGANGWVPYTLYYNTVYAPSVYTGIADLKGLALGALFLILYFFAAATVLSKKDI